MDGPGRPRYASPVVTSSPRTSRRTPERARARAARPPARAAGAAVVAAALAAGAVGPARAADPPPGVTAHLSCLSRFDDAFSYDPDGSGGEAPIRPSIVLASFGYTSGHPAEVTLPAAGATNFFNPGRRDRGQPSTFLPGRHEHAATVVFNGTATPKLFWVLDSTITAADVADTTTPRCAASALSAPSALAMPAAGVTDGAATLSGVVTAGGLETTAHLEWGTDPAALDHRTPDETVAADRPVGTVRAALEGLTPATTYHARVVATNALGTTASAPLSFTTASGPRAPGAVTGFPGAVGPDAATLAGVVDPRGRPTTVHFELGTDEGYGTTVPAAGLDGALATVTARVGGLAPGTTYHYRVVAQSDAGRSVGADTTFTTAPVPGVVPTTPPPGAPDGTAGPSPSGPLTPGGGSPPGLPTPPRATPRDPGLRVTVPARTRGPRTTLTVRSAAAAVGTLGVTVRRGGRAARVRRVSARGGTTAYRLSALRPGTYVVRVRFVGRDGWATRSVRTRLRVSRR